MGPAHPSRIFALATLLAAGMAHGVIYKSTERDGRVTFSDMPVQGAVNVQRVESSEGAKSNVGMENGPQYLALLDGFDEAVRQANARVDVAEHALALARRSILGDQDPLALAGGAERPSVADRQLIEFYKRDVASARRDLARVLQSRALLAARPVA
jgi:hypothetical protein